MAGFVLAIAYTVEGTNLPPRNMLCDQLQRNSQDDIQR